MKTPNFTEICVVLVFATQWLIQLTCAKNLRRDTSTCLPPPPSANFTYSYVGCYTDPTSSNRVLSGLFLTPGSINSPAYCISQCGAAGFSFAGVEYTSQCFCGNSIGPTGVKANESSCSSTCGGDSTAKCGAAYFINIYEISNPDTISPSKPFLPNCSINPLCSNGVCDTSLGLTARAAALIGAMTLKEKVQNVVNSAAGSSRLGLPPYQWWSEALHGVASSTGVAFQSAGSNFSAATSFPMPILTSAAFDDPLVHSIAKIIGTEGRAFANYGHAGFDFWTPNINPFRDPRWGRGMETPGEDPQRIQNYVYNLVTGMQGGVDPAEKLIISTCKHYAAYDIETNRFSNNLDPTQQDLAEYYLPPFKTCVRDGKGGSIMCSYNAVDGIPACASEYLLQTVLREHWGFSAPYNWVVSDCDAVGEVYSGHNYVSSAAAAAAVSLNAGTDLDCGSTYASLTSALLYNMTTEATLDLSLSRLYTSLLQVGYFDYRTSEYSSLSWSNVNTTDARTLAYKAAVEGCTLLKNDGILPLTEPSSSVALIGPWAKATTQMQGNYYGTAPYLVSPLSAFENHMTNVTYAQGTAINNSTNNAGFAAALQAANQSDYIIYFGGIDTTIEAESRDRSSIVWPGNQLDLIAQLAETGKPLIVVQCGGGQIDDSALLANPNVNAILWAGYPGQEGGNAIFDILTGKASVAGRLPITQYPANYTSEVTMYQMDLRPNGTYPGRTYKWYEAPVLPFGYGLHYTNFSLSWATTPKLVYPIEDLVRQAGGQYKDLAPFTNLEIDVKNIGGRANIASDYIGLLFVSTTNGGPSPYPLKELVSYGRLHSILPHSSQKLSFPLTLGNIARTDTEGNSYLYPGTYKLAVDIDAKLTFKFDLVGSPALIESLPPNPTNASAFEYLGCFTDASNGSTVSNNSMWAKTVNLGASNYPQLCVDQCKKAGYYYSGVKRFNCFCGSDFLSTMTAVNETLCSIPCPGNDRESCGGVTYFNAYNSTLPTFIQSPTTSS